MMSRLLLLVFAAAALGPALGGCSADKDEDTPLAIAREVTHRSELIGGPRALGDLGDVLMENDRIRVVIQAPGFSRGFGVYGGSVIDADLRRPSEPGNSLDAEGFDAMGEVFPAFFLQAVAVDEVEILDDGSDGGVARVAARGQAGDFLELAGFLNRAATGSHADPYDPDSERTLAYETVYELEPGAQHLRIRFSVENISEDAIQLPGPTAATLLPVLGLSTEGFTVPFGDIVLFGKVSPVFIPGIGFDVRFGLEESYGRPIDFPAFPGIVTEWLATRGDGVSYGWIVEESDSNFVYNKRDVYASDDIEITRSSMLLPFVAGGFLGVFHQEAPAELAPGDRFEVVKYLVLGGGDVGSVLDEIHRIRGAETGTLAGRAVDAVTGGTPDDASVFVYRRDGDTRTIYSQYDLRADGSFVGTLEPGEYSVRVAGEGREPGPFADVTITAGDTSSVIVAVPGAARITVQIVDGEGVPTPAKATAVGTYGAEFAGQVTRTFLFDLQMGEEFRGSDLVPDTDNPATRQYIEAIAFADARGNATMHVRPGTYEIVVSRGPEYDLHRETVTVDAGETASVAATVRRVVDTTGWIAADLHLHSVGSIDSSMDLDERLLSLAAEGVEWPVSTDHNFVTDYGPVIDRLGLWPWMNHSIGLELTTLESGHFNGYPLDYEVGPITHGAFEWARRPPAEIFDTLREMGAHGPENTIVQVNHARDTILGYFDQYNRDALTARPGEPGLFDFAITPSGPAFVDEEGDTTFSLDFDALEILNGKLFWQIRHYRIPEPLPEGVDPETAPPAGTILVDDDGEVAFPGVVDDWFNLLNLGERFIGIGTSDSHSEEDEAGYFRTMVYVGADDPRGIDELDFVRGLQSRRVVATNGPLVDFSIDGTAMGGETRTNDGQVEMTVTVTSAPWIGVSRVNIIRNGLLARTLTIEDGRDLAADPFEAAFTVSLATDADEPVDSWFVVEVIGYDNYFPVVRPLELPPPVLTDAIAGLAEPLGFGDSAFGELVPAEVFPVTAYAITNPIHVAAGPGPWEPPGVAPIALVDAPDQDAGLEQNPIVKDTPDSPLNPATMRPIGTMPTVPQDAVRLFERDIDDEYDIRRIFGAFGGSHGHAH